MKSGKTNTKMTSDTGIRIRRRIRDGRVDDIINGLISRNFDPLEARRIAQLAEKSEVKRTYIEIADRYESARSKGIMPSSASTLAVSKRNIGDLEDDYLYTISRGIPGEVADLLVSSISPDKLDKAIEEFHELTGVYNLNKYAAVQKVINPNF